jgi:RNA polymerase sigma-70 factor (ECF subfamily)
MMEDKLLVRRFNRGDTDALRRIYEKYKNDLFKIAAALLNDKDYIEDVVHDVFVSFSGTVGNFKLSGTLKGYLSICTANRARDRNRATKRQKNLWPDKAGPIRSDKNRPDESVILDELSEKLYCAMSLVPDDQREIIILHLLSKMRFRQIAKSKGVSINTIISRYRYGLDKLRSILDGEYEK